MAMWQAISGTPTLPDFATNAEFSPDDSMLALACEANGLLIYDTSTWTLVAGTPAVAGARHVTFSPDGQYMAVANGTTYSLYNVSTWTEITGLPAVGGSSYRVAFSADSAYLAVAHTTGDRATVVQLSDLSKQSFTPSIPNLAEEVAFGRNDTVFAVGHRSVPRLTLVDTSTWTAYGMSYPDAPNTIAYIAFSPNGRYLIYADQGFASPLHGLDLDTETVLTYLPTLASYAREVRIHPDGDDIYVAQDGGDYVQVIDIATGASTGFTPAVPNKAKALAFNSDGSKLAISYDQTPFLVVHEQFIPNTMDIVLEPTDAALSGEQDPAGTLQATIGPTVVNIALAFAVHTGNIAAVMGDVGVAIEAVHEPTARHVSSAVDAGGTVSTVWSQEMVAAAGAASPVETFYNPAVELTMQGLSQLNAVPAFVMAVQLLSDASATLEGQVSLSEWLRASGSVPIQALADRMAEILLGATASLADKTAVAETIVAAATVDISSTYGLAVSAIDQISADLLQESTMLVGIQETLEAEAGDSTEVLGRYLADVRDLAGAWVTFKVSGEVVQGWVMNVEGEQPISEYRGFDFNSFASIQGRYFAADDTGLHVLGESATDQGVGIDAHVRTMMLDFGTTAQKRVVAAYLGYTSTGTVVLKVRSVDNGTLVEHWYEATEVTADAPREGYRTLGRGLKSRYWQFEIANVDGADFEIDQLELQPIKLRRRV